MPFTLPGINHLPTFVPTAKSQLDESFKLNHPKSSGLESYRSSISSATDSLDGSHHSSISFASSSISDPKSQLSKQDCAIDFDGAAGSSPQASVSRKQSISLPPIRELMAPSTTSTPVSITPSSRTRTNSLVLSPQALPALTRPRSQGYLATSAQAMEQLPPHTRSPPHQVSYLQPSVNYGYTTTAQVGSSSPPTVVYTQQQRMGSVPGLYQHPQQHVHISQHQPRPQPQQFQHQPAPYLYSIPQHIQLQQGLPQTPRSQSEAPIVYFQQGSAHPQHYNQTQMISQPPSHLPINVVMNPTTRGSPEEPSKKEVKRRTRTGCLTCRRRRIKCDERKPHCNNCEKSKIYCAGYQTLRPTKTELKKMSKMMRVGSIIG